MNNIISLILGGGRGTRLYPLTKFRSKPAVPFAGKYRLIDIPISNCLNSGLNRVYILTQFLSVSLHRHVTATYKFDTFSEGFVEVLAAQQTLDRADWYQGTADAVRQNLRYIQQRGIDDVLILSGDQLYRMDYRDMLKTHLQSGADVTIGTLPVPRSDVSGFGVLKLDDSGRVVEFTEKPQDDAVIDHYRTSPEWIKKQGLEPRGREHLASMGIYLFRRDVLVDLLTRYDHTDFGKEVFPSSIESHHVQAHLFDGYWEDVGTIKSFMQSNLALASDNPPLSLDTEEHRIYTKPRYLPPTRMSGAMIKNSLIADGCTIGEGTVIENSVIGVRCRIGRDVTIRDSVVIGADYYDTPPASPDGPPPIGIGERSNIQGALIDKNCRIGRDVHVVNDSQREDFETAEVMVRDGIVVVPKDGVLGDGWRLEG